MSRAWVIAALSSILASCAGASGGCVTRDAQGLVTANRPDDQFRTMLPQVVSTTQTGRMLADRDGLDAISEAVDDAVERHGDQWERNLVDAWATLSSAEIEQACNALTSRDETAYTAFATRVGGKVQQLNEPLLRQAAAEVLETYFEAR